MKKPLLLEKERPYHIIVRTVEKRTIFSTEEERARFVVQMYAANIGRPGLNFQRREVQKAMRDILLGKELSNGIVEKEHDPLVTFFSFALVGNHYHFGLIGRFDGAISKYLQKLNTGFAKFFNLKHKRIGSLFQSRFQAVPIESEFHLATLIPYINIKNVVDVYDPHWAEKSLIDQISVQRFIRAYSYSSFPDLFLGRSSLLLPQSSFPYLKEILGENCIPNRDTIDEYIGDVLNSRGVASNSSPLMLE